MKVTKNIILILLLFITELSVIQAQDLIRVFPQEYPKALKNPLKGFRPDPNFTASPSYPYPTIVRQYIKWNEIERDSTDGVQKIIDFCNAKWKDFEKRNIKVIPRVYIQWDRDDLKGSWPSDLTYGDWTSKKFKDRVVKLIYKLGLAWDNDPRVAWVQTGIIGWWGEQESPVGVDEDGWAKLLGDAFDGAFKNKKFIVRNQDDWETAGYKLGTYWDSYAHPAQSGVHFNIKTRNSQGRYLTEIIEGETAYNWGNDKWDPKFGASPTITCNNYQYTNNLIDVIRDLHCTGLGWIASYKTDGSSGSNIDTVKTNAARIQEAFGYNFIIPEFSCSPRANQGTPFKIKFKVKNNGSAPIYEKWPLAFVLIDEATQNIVWKEELKSVDIRKWHPGDNYNYTTRRYQTEAVEYVLDTTITIPASIAAGQYMAAISILEPYSQTPGVFFDIKNFLSKNQTQPLCRIGVGTDLVGNHEINPAIFGDPLSNDTRTYSLTPKGFTYSLTTSTSNGTISLTPSGGKYLPGTVVTVIAKGNSGYKLSAWGGDLSGQNTVTTIKMDGNKSISASFEKIVYYGLTKNAVNGYINTVPSGSTYESGTKITVTAVNNLGYKFTGWSGDLSGSTNPTSIVIDGNKTITANFEKVQVYNLQKDAINGYITTTPTGDKFEVDTKVTVKAIANIGYKFTGWSGDLTGLTNPTTVVMDANKSIVANFEIIKVYELKRNAVNGSIIAKPSGSPLVEGSTVTVKAIADFGYKFTGWSGDLSGTTNPTSVVLDANKNITANFQKVEGNLVFATNCGGPEFTASEGVRYMADSRYVSGSTHSSSSPINGTNDDQLYQSERWGSSFSYSIPLLRGTYQVMLMFAEINYSAPNSRVFNVYIEGAKVISDLDIYSEVSVNTAYNETFFVDVNDGFLSISLNGIKENAKISAIKVMQVSIPSATSNVLNSHPEMSKLLQIFPNPFSTKTTIQYQLSKAAPVKLIVYNSFGEHLTTLVDEFQATGYYSVDWNVSDRKGNQLENGIYLFKLDTGNSSVQTMKSVLMR